MIAPVQCGREGPQKISARAPETVMSQSFYGGLAFQELKNRRKKHCEHIFFKEISSYIAETAATAPMPAHNFTKAN